MMLEKDIEKKLCEEVNKVGGKCLKLISPSWAGIPDRLVLMPKGRLGFVELKAPGKKPRKLQEKRIQELLKLGFKVYTVDSYDECKRVAHRIRGDSY